jgi:hypothetical protein
MGLDSLSIQGARKQKSKNRFYALAEFLIRPLLGTGM